MLLFTAALCVAGIGALVWWRRRGKSSGGSGGAGGAKPALEPELLIFGVQMQSAANGVTSSFAPSPKSEWWWLQGQRMDTDVLFHFLGEAGIREISSTFYTRVYADDESPWFRDLFARKATLQQSIDRQVAFFSQVFGGAEARYTDTNRPSWLRKVVKDHAGAKMFAMHVSARKAGHLTPRAAARWWHHMDAALVQLRPGLRRTHGEVVGTALEKTVRWFCDHVLERLVWGGPTESLFTLPRIVAGISFKITEWFVRHDVVPAVDDEAGGRAAAATLVRLPVDAVPYKRLPAVGAFTNETMPRGLLGRHNTKAEVWGQINCVRGQLKLATLDGELEEVVLSPGPTKGGVNPGVAVVNPRQYHQVTPLTADTEMFVHFHKRAGTDPDATKGPGFG